jgi:beta-lactamase superfamily II metal-dependent hydrolase
LLLLAAAAVSGLFAATAAHADQIVIQRNVTVREQPVAGSERVDYPPVGTALELLDNGVRRSGYYHVRLPDGREGWVYQSFVRRVADPAPTPPGPVGDRVSVHFIDVDQGAAALLEFPCGAILIDAGGRGEWNDTAAEKPLLDYLSAFFDRRTDLNRRLDAVFVTHTHKDHNMGLDGVARTFAVGGYIHNGRLHGSGRDAARWMVNNAATLSPPVPVVAVQDVAVQGVTNSTIDPLACPRVDPRIRVLSGGLTVNPGWSNAGFENGNNHSLIIRVDYGEASFLFTGDLEVDGLNRIATRLAGTPALDADVWAVSHHGAENGVTRPFLTAASPELVVISAGPPAIQLAWTAWQYGHPRRRTVELLDEFVSRPRSAPATVRVADGAKRFSDYALTDALYATPWDGNIIVSSGEDGVLQVATSRQP